MNDPYEEPLPELVWCENNKMEIIAEDIEGGFHICVMDKFGNEACGKAATYGAALKIAINRYKEESKYL